MAQSAKADIEINVKGLKQVEELLSKIDKISSKVNILNKTGRGAGGSGTKDNKLKKDSLKLSEAERASMAKTRNIEDQIVRAKGRGIKTDKAMAALQKAKLADIRGEVTLARTHQQIAVKELSIEEKITKQNLAQLKAEQQKAKTAQASARKRAATIGQSAIISGAFPLLFGQGPLVGAAGAIGGGLGAAFGGSMGGFAGGLAATSAVTAIQQFAVSAREVGDALKDPTRALDALSDAGIKVDDAVKQQVATLIDAGKEFEALEVVNRQLNESIGELATQNLKDLDTSFDKLDEAAGKLFLKFKSDLAPAFMTIIDLATKFVDSVGGRRIRNKAQELDPEAFREAESKIIKDLGGSFALTFSGELRDELTKRLTASSKDIINKAMPSFLAGGDSLTTTTGTGSSPAGGVASDAATFNAGTQIDEALKKQTDLVKKVKEESALTLRISELRANGLNPSIAKTVAGIEREAELSKKNLQTEIDKLLQIQARDAVLDETNQKTLTALEAQLNSMDDLTDSQIESVKVMLGLADAANKTRDAFDEINNSIANNISDGLTAAIQGTKTLGEAAKAILNDIGSTLIRLGVNTILGGIAPGLFGGLLGFSRGGRPPTGRPSIVGEKGPELFVPRRSGTIVPNDKLGGGSTNISVNVDASGSSVQGDEQQSKELGKAISAAIQSELLKQRRPGGLLR